MTEPEGSSARPGFVALFENLLLCILLAAVVVVASAQILLRVFLSESMFWANDLISMAVLWLAVIGAVIASREGRHIAIGVVTRYFPKPIHRPAAAISMLFAALVTGVLAWQAFRFVSLNRQFQDTYLWDLPAWWFQSVMPVGFAVMSFHFVAHAVASLMEDK